MPCQYTLHQKLPPFRAGALAGFTTKGSDTMIGALMYGPGDIRVETREDPTIIEPTDAILRVVASCIYGSDLWPYRGVDAVKHATPMGHEYVGVVEQVGHDVRSVKIGDFVVGSFFASDNTCEICLSGYQTACVHRQPAAAGGAQSELLRVPLADGTLVATPCWPPPMFSDRVVRRDRCGGRAGQDRCCRR